MGELAIKVRAKYPGAYDAIPDAELESKVMAKFPGVYDHLADSAPKTMGYTPEQLESAKQAGIASQQATTPWEKLKVNAADAARDYAPAIRTTLEAGGAALGGLTAGTAGGMATLGTGAIPATVAGGALGYAAGKNIADTLDELVGLRNNGNISERAFTTAKDILTGATMEAGGQLAARGISKGINYVGNAMKRPLPFTQQSARQSASTKLSDAYENVPLDTPPEMPSAMGSNAVGNDAAFTTQQATNAAKADSLSTRLGSNTQFTPAQRTGDMKAGLFEQGMTSQNGDMAAELATREANTTQTALGRIKSALGQGAPLPSANTTTEIGQTARTALDTGAKSAKASTQPLWEAIPNYEVMSQPLDDVLTTLSTQPMVKNTRAKIDGVIDYIKEIPKTVMGLKEISTTLNGEIKTARMAGDENTARLLGKIKDSIGQTFDGMSAAAANGDIALSNGKLVKPSQIQAEIATLEKTLSGAEGQALPLKDLNKDLSQYVRNNGGRTIMQNTGVSDAQFNRSLQMAADDLMAKGAPAYTPPTGGSNQQIIDNVKAGIAAKQELLAGLQPAEDIAALYNTAKQASKERYFDKFRTGTANKILGKGNESNSFRMSDESIAKRIFTPTGSSDIVNALGQDQAKAIMRDHVVNELSKLKDVPAMMSFINRNRTALKQLGLEQEAKGLVKNQLPNEFERILSTRRVNKITDEPYLTLQESKRLLQTHGNSIKQLYGQEALNTLRDYHDLMQILQRNKGISYSGGSNTAEKLAFGQQAADLGLTMASSRIPGATILRGIAKIAQEGHKAEVNQLLKDAILNPEKAKQLLSISKLKTDPDAYKSLALMLKPYITSTGIATTQGVPQ